MGRGWTNLWVLYFLGFVIAPSAVAILGATLFSWVGFPYGWTAALTVPAALTALFLLYRGYGLEAWLLVGCLALLLIGAAVVVYSFTAAEPTAPSATAREVVKASFDEGGATGLWGESVIAYGLYDGTDDVLEWDTARAIYHVDYNLYDTRLRPALTIEFPPLETPGGQWVFVGGAVQTRGALAGTFNADPADNWLGEAESILEGGSALAPAYPYLVVSLPLRRAHADQDLTLVATLTLAYPAIENPTTLTLTESTLTREVTVYLASGNFVLYQTEYDQWRRSRRVTEMPLLGGFALGGVLAAAAGVFLVRRGALQRTSAGGFGSIQLVTRRAGGLQKLGVEAHPLAAVSYNLPESISEGVVLGVINAQSPAGRAGFRSGDVLFEFADQSVKSPAHLNRLAGRFRKGDLVTAQLWRDGQTLTLTVRFT